MTLVHPIRVSFVIPTLDQSGAEKQLTMLATGLPRDRFEVEVIALNRGGYYQTQLESAQIPVTILNKRLRIDPIAHWKLRSHLQQQRPNLVHSWLFAANTHVRLLRNRYTDWKCVVSERCVDSWKSGWQLSLDRRLKHSCDAMIANSASVAEFYQAPPIAFPADKLTVIHNGIQIPEQPARQSPSFRAERADWLKRWSFPENAFVIGSIGRLAAQKNVETLLWAMHMLKFVRPEARALFIGAGPERGRLLELADKYDVLDVICFAGHQDDAAKSHRYWDAFWQASRFEGQSNSLLEALAAGLPVLASDISPNRELIEPNRTGLLIASNNSAEFATAVRKIIEQPQWAQELGCAARNQIEQQFSVQRMIKQHVALYEQLLRSDTAEA